MFDDWVSESRKQINVCFIICNMRGNDEESSQKKKKKNNKQSGHEWFLNYTSDK